VVAKALGFANWGDVTAAIEAARSLISAEWQGIRQRM